MTKYDESFKLEVVQSYLSGAIGAQRLAVKYVLDPGTVRRWVEHYRQHGEQGLRKKYSHYDEHFKLSVLHRMWQEDLSCRQVGALFDLRGGTNVVVKWDRLYHEGGLDALKPKPRGRLKKMTVPKSPPEPLPSPSEDMRTLEQLRKENEYLRTEVAYLKKLSALVLAKKQVAQKKRS